MIFCWLHFSSWAFASRSGVSTSPIRRFRHWHTKEESQSLPCQANYLSWAYSGTQTDSSDILHALHRTLIERAIRYECSGYLGQHETHQYLVWPLISSMLIISLSFLDGPRGLSSESSSILALLILLALLVLVLTNCFKPFINTRYRFAGISTS